MENQYQGTIISIGAEVQVSEKFRKRTFMMSDKSAQYPQTIEFECTQDRCNLLVNYAPGSLVNVSFNLRGRQWTNPQGEVKTFNTLDVWRMALVAVDSGAEPK